MARYKHIDTASRFLAVDLYWQLLPGTFEHAMNHLICARARPVKQHNATAIDLTLDSRAGFQTPGFTYIEITI